MRIIVFFDLPTETAEERRAYTRFRKFLIRSGFIMQQESVYSKLVLNGTVCEAVKESVRGHKVKGGNIQMLTVSEKQFANMEFVTGGKNNEVIDTDERLVVL